MGQLLHLNNYLNINPTTITFILHSRSFDMADDVPHNEDKRLLERLNALKPSTVQLERQRCAILSTDQYNY